MSAPLLPPRDQSSDKNPPEAKPLKFRPSQAKHEWEPKKHYITFYLPSRNNDGKALDFRVRSDLKIATMTFLLKNFEGATLTEGKGYFIGTKDGRTHEEDVTLCRSFCEFGQLLKHDGLIRSLANALAIEADQDMISVEIDDVMYFYKPTDVYRKIYQHRVINDRSDYHQLLEAAEESRSAAEDTYKL